MKNIFTLLAAVLLTATTFAQVGINIETPDPSAALDITSTTGGLLMPRMTKDDRGFIDTPATGLIVYQTDGTPGFYYFNGTSWAAYYSQAEVDALIAALDARITALEDPPANAPGAPIIGTATAGDGEATISFTAPSSNGGSPITSYTATSNPGDITATVTQADSGDITVTGLTNNTTYTFTVTATNAIGTSVASAASNSVLLQLQIGYTHQGGVVFYLFVEGETGYVAGETHGLVAAVADQSSGIQWYNGSFLTTGATGTAVGTGSANTDAIIAAQGATETSYAAGLARAYTGGGYTDWFLPSKDELIFMHSYIGQGSLLGNIGNFADDYYWSSTEFNTYFAWEQDFVNGPQYHNAKNYTNAVRAVRAF